VTLTIIFNNNKSTKYCQITLRVKKFNHERKVVPFFCLTVKSPYSIIERRVPELIPVLCSQPAGDVSHKPGGRPAVTHATLKRAVTSFAAW